MHLFLFTLAFLTLLLWVAAGIEVTLGGRKLEHLERIAPLPDAEAIRISVVIPACNEERNIEEALSSVLAQDYPDLEVIAVDDRSTDSTGAILDRMAELNPRLRVVHTRVLPEGWLGKNHALQQGAALAGGAILLFTDADVVMERSTLRRAAAYLQQHRIDHLAVIPHAILHGFPSHAFVALFALLFNMYIRPWKVRDPKSRAHIGIGAFNMVRTAAYWGAGGHEPIAMRPDDDIKLGKLLKLRGYRSDAALGFDLLSVEWYPSFRELRRGLMKNLFAGVDYRISMVLLSSVCQLAFLVWPFVAVFTTTGVARLLNMVIVLSLFVTFGINSRGARIAWWWCLTMPLAALLSVYLMMRSMILALKNGGIEWRGTHYPLDKLRANRV